MSALIFELSFINNIGEFEIYLGNETCVVHGEAFSGMIHTKAGQTKKTYIYDGTANDIESNDHIPRVHSVPTKVQYTQLVPPNYQAQMVPSILSQPNTGLSSYPVTFMSQDQSTLII